MSGITLAAAASASIPAAAETAEEKRSESFDGPSTQAITVGDNIRVKNNRPGRVFQYTSFQAPRVDSVPRSTGGTVGAVGDGNWYSINWNINRNVANGWTPGIDIYEF